MSDTFRIAAIGDVHGRWNDADRGWFDSSDYDAVMFVGDLATYRRDGTEVARNIARLQKPTLLFPGNHDGIALPHLAAEAIGAHALFPLVRIGQQKRRRHFAAAAHPLVLCGYCHHALQAPWGEITVIGARPHSMGGRGIAFRALLKELYGVHDVQSSAAKLCALVDDARNDIVFLAHNGPTGLGAERDDIWGCDFKRKPEDFGDEDLRLAIEHAQRIGKRVRAVIAGHMHHQLKGGGVRRWRVSSGDTAYVNAARVPRIVRSTEGARHHHVRVTIGERDVATEPMSISL